MQLSRIKPSSQNNVSSKQQTSLDNHEMDLRKQISNLEEEKKSISNDKNKTNEEKKREKQAVQEEIQTLNSELRQYQIQKRQEEAAKKQEALKEAAKDASDKESKQDQDSEISTFGNEDSGVLISLSATKKQIANMQRIRTDLERKQRTAVTDEDKSDLQKKAANVTRNIGRKITITEGSISNSRNSKKKGANTKQNLSDQPFDWKASSDMISTTDTPEEPYKGNLIANRKKFFSTVSIFIR